MPWPTWWIAPSPCRHSRWPPAPTSRRPRPKPHALPSARSLRFSLGCFTDRGSETGRDRCFSWGLAGALAAAELQRITHFVAPVPIHVREQLRRLGQIVGHQTECFHLVPQHIVAERLARLTIVNIMLQNPAHCLRRESRGNALYGHAESHHTGSVVTAT